MRYSQEFQSNVLAALRADPWSVGRVASIHRVSRASVARWAKDAGIKLPSPLDRQTEGARTGAPNALNHRWGDFRKRRTQAIALRKKGKTYQEIAAALGYRHESSVHYALQGK